MSTDPISGNSFINNIKYYNKQGRTIYILTGTHGDRLGYSAFGCNRRKNRIVDHADLAEIGFYNFDVVTASSYRNTKAYDITYMSDNKFKRLLNSNDVAICAWCFSERSKDVIKAVK